MAAYRCKRLGLSFILYSVFVASIRADLLHTTQVTENNAAETVLASGLPERPPETGEQTPEETPQVDERRWEATEVKEEHGDDDDGGDDDAAASVHAVDPPSVPPSPDEFKEELVIRPLHSGDIYASFQFRTVWDTDFMGGQKGMCRSLSILLAPVRPFESFVEVHISVNNC